MSTAQRSIRRRRVGITAVAAFVAIMIPVHVAAKPSQNECERRNNNSYDKLLDCMRLKGVREHQAALQAIADANGGTRAEQTPGYTASVDYVEETLLAAGWDVTRVPFTYPGTDVLLDQLTPVAASYPTSGAIGTDEGDVTGNVIPVDINLTPPRANSSGCTAADYVGLGFEGPDDIALIQRGTCTFAEKAIAANAAGAEAVIIFNQGNTDAPDRNDLFTPTLSPADPDIPVVPIPVVAASFTNGAALAQAGSTAHVVVDFVTRESENVIAELAGDNDENVVMAGSHLDSVPAGPGINDNGSGSAVLLELAQQVGKIKPQNTLRFAWWGAEEIGLIGSTQWVLDQSPAELDRIALYLNFDMVGSPNHVFMVYDANQSSFVAPVAVPPGSAAIESTFESFYTYAGVPYDDTAFSGRSDYQAFINHGIPSSGLFTGAEQIKSQLQQSIWGGTTGAQFDPCYHQACDTFANNNDAALDVNADAVAFAVLTYAYSTEAVNGVPGREVPGRFTIPAPAGPEHTFAGPLGGEHGHLAVD
jgi:Zn-dependent M28 family amino/carboxypeptidase